MKVAYWPGCVSRGFTPELHGSMAKVAPLLDIELVELDRACLLRRRRDRRAQPGARRHAERPHVRARPAGRQRRGPDDEHLLDLPGRAERVPGAPRREHRVPRRTSTRRSSAEGLTYEKGIANKHFLWLMVEEIGLDDDQVEGQAAADQPARRPVLRLLHRAPDRPPGHRRRPPARHLPAPADRGARRHRRRLRRPVQVLRLPDHHDEQGERRSSRRAATSATRSTPRPTASSRRARCATSTSTCSSRSPSASSAARSACRCCTCRSSSASPSASSRRSWAWASTSSSRPR